MGRQALKKAYSEAGNREEMAPGLFDARQSAIRAGAAYSTNLKKEMTAIDEDVAAIADKINKVDTKELAIIQTRYVELEKMAVIETQLGKVQAQINGAKKNDAAKRAPLTLRTALISVKNAESLIGSNISNPSGYKKAVIQANYDAEYLSDVMLVMKQNGKALKEPAALKLVAQKRQITNLENNLSTSEDETLYVESKLDAKNKALQDKTVALGTAEASVAMQRAIEKSRQQFSPSEAVAYQQGETLLIRLKSINFKSGRSEVPTQSMGLLAKVSDVAKTLSAKGILVIGHTDSVGSVEANKNLSEKRAQAVATYFKTSGVEGAEILSEGHGFEEPIATNKSKSGRALNRRVDVIITPEGDTAIR